MSTTTPLRILVVEDNAALRENLAEALELEGFRVVVAADGAGALAKLAEDPPPNVVLLDLVMPGMDGADVLSRIRENPRLGDVRVVLTTGLSGVRSRVPNADAVLIKPFGVNDLLATLERVGAGAP